MVLILQDCYENDMRVNTCITFRTTLSSRAFSNRNCFPETWEGEFDIAFVGAA